MELFTEAEEYDVDDVSPYENNPKEHPEKQIEKLKDSIREFGFTVPILITETGELIAGHGRLEAAQRLGMDKVPAIVRDDLDDEQVRAFRIADNRVAESGWDEDMLETELERLE